MFFQNPPNPLYESGDFILYNNVMSQNQNILPSKFIILHAVNTSEADKTAYGISDRYGYVEIFAKGARKPKAKFQNLLESGYLAEIKYIKSHKNILTDVVPHNAPWNSLFTSMEGLSLLNYICEVSMHAAKQHHDNELNNEELFSFISNYLIMLSENMGSPFNILLDFDINIMQIMGYRPDFSACSQHGYTYLAGFSMNEARCLCGRCDDIYGAEHCIAMDIAEVETINKLMRHDMDENIDKELFLQIHSLLLAYIEFHGYFRIKSNKMLYEAYGVGND